ncbi:hypothetical protein KL929_004219 [Ogataea haglerorum]|nr:hypothetical protein KL929_004219 [Ogataea haglerorum]
MAPGKQKPVRKRQKYSRNGCLACKKRKVKCDETFPTCGRCAKIGAECIYYRVFKFQGVRSTNPEPETPHVPHSKPDSEPELNDDTRKSVTEGLSNLLANQEMLFGGIAGLSEYFENDNNATDLQSLLPDYDFSSLQFNNRARQAPDGNLSTSDSVLRYDYLYNLRQSFDERDLNKIANSLHINASESLHLQAFVKDVHLILFPLATSYLDSPFIVTFLAEAQKSNYLLNAMLASGARFLTEKARIDKDIHLAKFGAQADKSYIAELDTQIDINDKYRVHYLSICFQSLRDILENMNNSDEKVEPALLTSLILAADLSSNRDYRWSLHLRGAKQFLGKFMGEKSIDSDSLILARYLFCSMEISSGIASAGASSLDLDELTTWIPIPLNHGPLPKLSKMGMVTDGYIGDKFCEGGFKMYLGYSDGTAEVEKEIVAAKRNEKIDPFTIAHIFSVIDRAKQFRVVTNKMPYMIPIDSKYHPLYKGADKTRLSISGYYHVTSAKLRAFFMSSESLESDFETYSWFSFYDFTQNIRLETLYLYVLTSEQFLGCKVSNPVVQRLLKKVLQSCSFFIQLKHKDLADLERYYNSPIMLEETTAKPRFNESASSFFLDDEELETLCQKHISSLQVMDFDKFVIIDMDHRIAMFQWCLIMCAYCCIDAVDKVLVDCLLHTLLAFGLKSVRMYISKVKKIWTQRQLRYKNTSGKVFTLDESYDQQFFTKTEFSFLFT